MTDEDSTLRIEAALNGALQAAIKQEEDGFVTKWAAVVESTNEEGKIGCWILSSDGAKMWDVNGMFQYAIDCNHARLNNMVAKEEE